MELRFLAKDLIPLHYRKKYQIRNIDWDGTSLHFDSDVPVPPEIHDAILQELGLEIPYSKNKNASLKGDETLECFFSSAFQRRTTDIHFETQEKKVDIRYRIDGHLQIVDYISYEEYQKMIRVIKLKAGLDITENRLPQEGGFRHEAGQYDIRVSIVPSLYGEKTVLRILPIQKAYNTLQNLGMTEDQIHIIQQAVQKRSGSIIVNGPTGSGKSTTLHAILQEIDCKAKSVLSIEDPIEIVDSKICQFQVNEALGLTYAEYLRRVLRQDPDVILLGEIRDKETARLACEASLTGHYVLSTIHTKTTADVVLRLLEMQLEPFLIADALHLIIHQRLVRKPCPYCSKGEEIPSIYQELLQVNTQKRGQGCYYCNNTGYLGRIGLFEINQISEKARDFVFSFLSHADLDQCMQLLNEGIRFSMKDHASMLIRNGLTTYQEVLPCL
jgi:type IV pilus assembly protein PilB